MKKLAALLVLFVAVSVWLQTRNIGIQRELSRSRETVASQEKQLADWRRDIQVLATRLAGENHKAGRISYLFTEITPHTFVSGLYPNMVIGNDLNTDCGKRFTEAYNAETRRLVQEKTSQPSAPPLPRDPQPGHSEGER